MFSIRDIEQQVEDKKLNEYLDELDEVERLGALEEEAIKEEEAEAEAEKDER